MKKLLLLVLALTLIFFSGASPILTEKQAKQLLRSRRQDRPSKPGFPDEPMRAKPLRVPERLTSEPHFCLAFADEQNDSSKCRRTFNSMQMSLEGFCLLGKSSPSDGLTVQIRFQREYMHYLLRLEHRAEEQFLEHWLNPHCKPHCDRNIVHPV